MDAKQLSGGGGDGVAANFAGMSKNQLYDIMCKMKALIEQNPQQARDILIQNPLLTKALFQAQIMLGMVQAPQVIPKIQPSQQSVPVVQSSQPMSARPSHSIPAKVNFPDETTASQTLVHPRDQHLLQPVMPNPSAMMPAANVDSQPLSMPAATQLHRPMQTGRIPQVSLQHPQQQPVQPPFPSQGRNPALNQQYPLQMGPNGAYHQPGGPQQTTQPHYPPPSVGSFAQGQNPVHSQLPSVAGYQAGQSTVEFGHQGSAVMQIDRGYGLPGLSEQSITATNPPALHPAPPAPTPAQAATLSPEMQMALLQQVMSLTPEQINNLPPEQRNQVLQLQQMLRQ
ncbi:hypothetical protein MLD38_012477 [Melastoma candidum]|uniref:Uncharacterized protein n=1 Tax=Melastoma candidum TaxID=119954 RepID=A0ACB9R6F9_9MYRT|nr:hypothetical protein MLD38_012477 [Melastoma candidum]